MKNTQPHPITDRAVHTIRNPAWWIVLTATVLLWVIVINPLVTRPRTDAQVPTKNLSTFCDGKPIDLQHPCLTPATHSVSHAARVMVYDNLAKGVDSWCHTLYVFVFPTGYKCDIVFQPGTTHEVLDWLNIHASSGPMGALLLATSLCGGSGLGWFSAACGVVAAYNYESFRHYVEVAAFTNRCFRVIVETGLDVSGLLNEHMSDYGIGGGLVWVWRTINGQFDKWPEWHNTRDNCKYYTYQPGSA